jgi:hypothetical protein
MDWGCVEVCAHGSSELAAVQDMWRGAGDREGILFHCYLWGIVEEGASSLAQHVAWSFLQQQRA